jgi:hypothetical protein
MYCTIYKNQRINKISKLLKDSLKGRFKNSTNLLPK